MTSDTLAIFQMWFVFAVILAALTLYITDKFPMELTSAGVVATLLIFFHFFPVAMDGHANVLDPSRILRGIANPALITLLALLIVGQGISRTGMLDRGSRLMVRIGGKRASIAVLIILVVVIIVSGFLNNTPIVVIFIPIMQAIATRYGQSTSKLMIPLSFAAILGGMTTLVGSSTNLLVNSELIATGHTPFSFFDFTIPGLVLAGVGLVYLLLIAPFLLPERSSTTEQKVEGAGKHFMAQITISKGSKRIGTKAIGGMFPSLTDMTVRIVERGSETIWPPFEDFEAKVGDTFIVAATRKSLSEAVAHDPGLLDHDLLAWESIEQEQQISNSQRMLAEVMITPTSRLTGQTMSQIAFRLKTNCVVLGIQRRSRMTHSQLSDIRLRAGDILLIQGEPDNIDALKLNGDLVLLEWSTEELPALDHAKRASILFFATITLAATGFVPIVVAAVSGAVAMVAFGVLNTRQAARALDARIITTIVAALAMGAAMYETGGAEFIAQSLVAGLSGASPAVVISMFFLIVAIFTNIISNNAVAVLFTPIALNLADQLGVSPVVLATTVVFAANCSFASPLGYQTNLLVMGPGNYKFADFAKVGIPLIIILWITYSLFAPWYYEL